MLFPQYEGESTRLWITQAEDYFELFSIDVLVWVLVTAKNFSGPAKRWAQSLNKQLRQLS